MPPLRDRREDILPLARHFATAMNGAPIGLSQPLALALLKHDWPGNARALQGIIERLVLAHGDGESLPAPPWLGEEFSEHARVGIAATVSSQPEEVPKRTKKRFKPDAAELTALLEQYDGNVTALAEEVGIGRNTVYRWIKRLGLELDGHR
jgi:transcriptional regulator with PAS, ATPase and Fis domain